MNDNRGIDSDLSSCLEFNHQPGYSEDDITKVLAVSEGQNDGDNWLWLLQLNSGKFVLLDGGCDYTGWDCQSWARSTFHDTVENALEQVLKDSGQSIHESFLEQLKSSKKETWSEPMDKEFSLAIFESENRDLIRVVKAALAWSELEGKQHSMEDAMALIRGLVQSIEKFKANASDALLKKVSEYENPN